MVCVQCNGDIIVMESIHTPTANYKQCKCKTCGTTFFTKEVVTPKDEVWPVFAEWNRERGRKYRASKKGEFYDFKFADGRENKPEPKRKLRPLL